MRRILIPMLTVGFLVLFGSSAAFAQDYVVSLEVGGEPVTLTVTIEGGELSVLPGSPAVEVVDIQPVEDEEPDVQDPVSAFIEYDDLFRYNEEHVGKTVRYVGQILQVQERLCLSCENPSYAIRIAITEERFGLWEDVIWVEYEGTERFLDEDIVTFSGTVEGLQTYNAVLGNVITLPKVTATEIELGRELGEPNNQTSGLETSAYGPTANGGANLRGGPGTNYAVVGGVEIGEALTINARNNDGSWFQLASGAWIAAFLVNDAPSIDSIDVAANIPEPPSTNTSVQTQPETTTESPVQSTSSIVGINEELNGLGWRFKVTEVHKRKAVYLHDSSYVAMGNYLVVIIDAVNEQSGSDYFAKNLKVYVTDSVGNVYRDTGKASVYAQWQYGGLSSEYSDVNPGSLARVALAFDIPEGVGDVMLSTDIPAWVRLGNFSDMVKEDK